MMLAGNSRGCDSGAGPRGDKYSYLSLSLCLLDTDSGEVIEEGRLRTTPEAFPGDALTPSGRSRSRSPSRSAHTHPGRAECSKNAATKCWLPTLPTR